MSTCSSSSAAPYGAGLATTTDANDGSPVVPDAVTVADYQGMLWRRLDNAGVEPPKLYSWNPNATSDATYLKWVLVTDGYFLGRLSGAANPTTTEIPNDKEWALYKNTTSGDVFLATNDGGAIKKVTLS